MKAAFWEMDPGRFSYAQKTGEDEKMATFKIAGLDEYVRQLAELEHSTDEVIKRAVYTGGGVVADAVREEIESLPEHKKGTPGGVKGYERETMLEGMGVSAIQTDEGDLVNVQVGFAGYHDMPDGSKKPIPMIARSVAGGTSFSPKQPFVRTAVRRKKTDVEKAMQDVFEDEVNRIMKKK